MRCLRYIMTQLSRNTSSNKSFLGDVEAPGEETSNKVGKVDGDDSHCGDDGEGEDDIGDKGCTYLLILQLFVNIRRGVVKGIEQC